jgi:hypothetical protein
VSGSDLHGWALGIGIEADASGFHHLSPVPEHGSTGLGLLILVPDFFWQ